MKSANRRGEVALITLAELCFKVMWVFGLILLLVLPYQISSVMSICYWVMTLGNLFCFICALFSVNPSGRQVSLDLALLLLLGLISFLSLFMSGNFSLTVDNILGYLQLLGVLMAIYNSRIIGRSESFVRFLGVINIAIALLFIFLSLQSFAYRRWEIIVNTLSLGYSNPNLTAIYIFMNATMLLITFADFKKTILKLAILGLIVSETYMLYKTGSRAAFFAFLFICMVYVFPHKNFKIPKIVTCACVLFPLIFLFFYTFLYESGLWLDAEILGKEIYSGREVYFSAMLSELNRSKWSLCFGNFGGFNNMHNSALAILTFFGIGGAILYYINWLYTLFSVSKGGFQNKAAYIAFISVLALHIHSCAEAALVIGGGMWCIFIPSVFSMARQQSE